MVTATRDESDAQDHRHSAAEAGRDFRGIVVIEIWIKRAEADADGGDAEGHEQTVMRESTIIQSRHVEQEIAQKHEQFAEQEQRYENQPELAPQQSAQRNRRALQNPESFAFQADRRETRSGRRRRSARNRRARDWQRRPRCAESRRASASGPSGRTLKL